MGQRNSKKKASEPPVVVVVGDGGRNDSGGGGLGEQCGEGCCGGGLVVERKGGDGGEELETWEEEEAVSVAARPDPVDDGGGGGGGREVGGGGRESLVVEENSREGGHVEEQVEESNRALSSINAASPWKDGLEEGSVRVGVASSKGGRSQQDDRSILFSMYMPDGERATVAAVMDGHHGSDVSDMVMLALPRVLIESLKRLQGDVVPAMKATVERLDTETYVAYRNGNVPTGGTTLLLLVIVGRRIYSANVGDCKAVLSSKGAPEALTEAHNPPVESEKKRFEDAGVPCFSDHIGGSDINVCRTLGDYDLGAPLKWRCCLEHGLASSHAKGPLSSKPDIEVRDIEDVDEFIVAATDGVWDYFTPESTVITQTRRRLRMCQEEDQGCLDCASWLVDASLERQREVLHSETAGDNVTVVILQLRPLIEIPRASASRLNLRRVGSMSS